MLTLFMVLNGIGAAVGIITLFATRREVERLETRTDNLEKRISSRTAKLHKRVNRLLAVQSLIAGQVGVVLEKEKIHEAIEQLARDEEEEEEEGED